MGRIFDKTGSYTRGERIRALASLLFSKTAGLFSPVMKMSKPKDSLRPGALRNALLDKRNRVGTGSVAMTGKETGSVGMGDTIQGKKQLTQPNASTAKYDWKNKISPKSNDGFDAAFNAAEKKTYGT